MFVVWQELTHLSFLSPLNTPEPLIKAKNNSSVLCLGSCKMYKYIQILQLLLCRSEINTGVFFSLLMQNPEGVPEKISVCDRENKMNCKYAELLRAQ